MKSLESVCYMFESLWSCAILWECNTTSGVAEYAPRRPPGSSGNNSNVSVTTPGPVERRRLLHEASFAVQNADAAAELDEFLQDLLWQDDEDLETWFSIFTSFDNRAYFTSVAHGLETWGTHSDSLEPCDQTQWEEPLPAAYPRTLQYDDRRRRSSRIPTAPLVTEPPCNRSMPDCNWTETTTGRPVPRIPRGSLREIQCERLETLSVVARGRCTMEWRALLRTFECIQEGEDETSRGAKIWQFNPLVLLCLIWCTMSRQVAVSPVGLCPHAD